MATVTSTQTKPRFTSQELSAKLTEHITELAEETDAARLSEAMLEYLDLCSKFHDYSPSNVWLIMLSCPQATHVAGFRKWKSMGRYVRKGERGIPILAPVIVKDKDDDGEEKEQLVGFKVVYVFDVSQTEGEDLPEAPNWKSPEQNELLAERLIKFAESKGITVQIKELSGEVQGMSKGGAILLSPEAGTKTLVHEIAHELMHQDEGRPFDRKILELEAESVGYVVAKHFGLEDLASPNYVALHGASSDLIMKHLNRIRDTATQIIKAIEVEEVIKD